MPVPKVSVLERVDCNVELKHFKFVYTFSASVSSLFVPPSTVLAMASLIFLYSSP